MRNLQKMFLRLILFPILSYLHIFPKNVGGTLNLCRRILQCANVRKKCHKILLGLPNTALGILYILNARCFYE